MNKAELYKSVQIHENSRTKDRRRSMCTTIIDREKTTTEFGSLLVMFLLGSFSVQVGGAQTMPGVMSQGEMLRVGDVGCPMMTELATSVSRILSYRDEINLSSEQVDQLKNIRDSYQNDAVQLYVDLRAAMLELSNDLESEEIDMDAIKTVNNEFEKNQSELRSRNIEVFLESRAVLTTAQIEELRTRGLWNTAVLPWHQGMMKQ
jgi:Spy/CpxP family protein refolding chaperone